MYELMTFNLWSDHIQNTLHVYGTLFLKRTSKKSRFQRSTTKSIFGFGKLDYSNKLSMLSPDKRDMIQKFKFKHGLNGINWFTVDKPSKHKYNTRHHDLLLGETSHSNFQHSFFLNRIVNDWNKCRKIVIKQQASFFFF